MFTVEAVFILFLSLPLVAGSTTSIIECTNDIVNFNLIDPAVSPPLFTELTPFVDLANFSTCKLSIAAEVASEPSNCNKTTVQCVQFYFDGVPARKEKFSPYTLYGDIPNGGAITARQPKAGKHTIKACTYSDKACTKNEMGCKEMEVDFLHCGRAPVASVTPAPVAPVTLAPVARAPVTPISAPVDIDQLKIACRFISQFNLTRCQQRTIFDSDTTGSTTIPSELGLLTQLARLDLSFNQLTGTIPTTLGQLTQLTFLSLIGNQLIGTIPSTLGQLTQLTLLFLGSNQLSGTIPSTLGQLTQLNRMDLNNNQLIGTIPSTLGRTQLTALYLDNIQLTGTIPSTLGRLTQLTALSLWNNQLTGTIPSTFGQLIRLNFLGLWNNQLNGTISSRLCSIPRIRLRIDCGEILCSCCLDSDTFSTCPA